jgi:hypothetical protein
MKGGIGKCVAVEDCIAENPDDLMFMTVRIGVLLGVIYIDIELFPRPSFCSLNPFVYGR